MVISDQNLAKGTFDDLLHKRMTCSNESRLNKNVSYDKVQGEKRKD